MNLLPLIITRAPSGAAVGPKPVTLGPGVAFIVKFIAPRVRNSIRGDDGNWSGNVTLGTRAVGFAVSDLMLGADETSRHTGKEDLRRAQQAGPCNHDRVAFDTAGIVECPDGRNRDPSTVKVPLVATPLEVITTIGPSVAPLGTITVKNVAVRLVIVAGAVESDRDGVDEIRARNRNHSTATSKRLRRRRNVMVKFELLAVPAPVKTVIGPEMAPRAPSHGFGLVNQRSRLRRHYRQTAPSERRRSLCR